MDKIVSSWYKKIMGEYNMIDYLTFIEELYKIKMQEESVDNVLTKYETLIAEHEKEYAPQQ